jgi:DNA-binding NarL/FixJ family response regulator
MPPRTVHLTPKRERVVQLVAEGKTNSEIAAAIGTTEFAIKNYLRAIYDETGMDNRIELALWYLAHSNQDSDAA